MPFHWEETPCPRDQGWSAASSNLCDKIITWSGGGHLLSAAQNYWESILKKISSALAKMVFLNLQNQGLNPGSSLTSIKMYT